MWFVDGDIEVREVKNGVLLRKDQKKVPSIEVGDRFFDVANGRWALLLRIRPAEEAMGAPFEALYDGCATPKSFIGPAMYCDIGAVAHASEE